MDSVFYIFLILSGISLAIIPTAGYISREVKNQIPLTSEQLFARSIGRLIEFVLGAWMVHFGIIHYLESIGVR